MNNQSINYSYPPDFQKAKKHRLANRIFKGNLQLNSEFCQCCGKKIGQELVQTGCNIETSQLSFLGPGVPLFFLFLRFIIIILLVMCIFFMGFALYSNSISQDCGTISSCIPNVFNTLSLLNKKSNTNYMAIQSYLGLVFVIVCIFIFHYFRYKARVLEQQCDEVIDSPSDYAIILRRLPDSISQADIHRIIKEKRQTLGQSELDQTLNLAVNKIVLSYSLHEYSQISNQNHENFKTAIKQKRISEFKALDLPKPTKTSQIAILVFESQLSKDFFIYKPNLIQKIQQFFCTPCTPLSNLQVKDEYIGIQRAPEPDDIFWQNSGITVKGGIYRKIGTGVISLFILLIGGGVQYGLSLFGNTTTDLNTKTILNTLSSIIVTVFNMILMISLQILTKKQRNQTLTQFQTVLMVKITMFQFLNAGIFVILAQIAANFQNFSLLNGICQQITIIIIMNSVIPNMTLFFLQYFEIINRILRYCVEKQWLIYTQAELNSIFLGPLIQIPKKYAYILKTLWLTALYATLVPLTIGISMIGLLIFYYVQKFLYTRSYSMPNNVSSMTYESSIQLLEYFLITFSIGQLIIYSYFYNFQYDSIPISWTITMVMTIVLSLLNSMLPMESINQYFFKIDNSSKSSVSYSQAEQKFEVTYEMTNPAYQTKRERKNLKDYLGVILNQQNSSKVAVQLTNLFKNTSIKEAESIRSQKPLLNDLIEGQPKVEQKKPISWIDLDETKNVLKETDKIDFKKQNEKLFEDTKQYKIIENKNMEKQLDRESGKVQMGKSQGSAKQLQNTVIIDKDAFESQSKVLQIFGKIQNKNLPKFVKKWKGEGHLQKQKKSKQMQMIQKKDSLSKLSESKRIQQSNNIKSPLLSQSKASFDGNVDKMYVNLQKKKQDRVTKETAFDATPITSKYHLTNGKMNIYDQYHDGHQKVQHAENIIKNYKQKQKKYEIKNSQIKQKDQSKFKFLVVNQVPKKSNRKNIVQNSERDDGLLFQKIGKQRQISNNVSIFEIEQTQKAINDNYAITFGKGSNVSKSSIDMDQNEEVMKKFKKNEIQFKDQQKQKKATYNPISLTGSYKNYFNQKNQQFKQTSEYQGYLNKKIILDYIGTPFLHLAKQQDEQGI